MTGLRPPDPAPLAAGPLVDRRDGWLAGALAVSLVLGYLALAQRTTLWDRDEPRFAQAAVEMVDSGQYLYPTFNGDVRAQKPVLIYWLMALSIHVFGVTELAVRFWSPVGLGVSAVFTYLIGRRVFGSRPGLLAMAIIGLTPLTWVEGTAATADAVLLAALTAALAMLIFMTHDGYRTRYTVGLTIALTVGQLTKGPIALAIPLLAVAGALVVGRDAIPQLRKLLGHVGIAVVISAAVFLAWFLPANAATDGRFWEVGLVDEVVARAFIAAEGHGGHLVTWLPFYAAVIIVGFLPWTLYLPAALRELVRGNLVPAQGRAFLLGCPITRSAK